MSVSGNAYYRDIQTDTLQRRHQRRLAGPVAVSAERGRAGRTRRGRIHRDFRRAAPTPSNTPFPSWRCIANVPPPGRARREVQRPDQSSETSQHNGGGFGQLTMRHSFGGGDNQFTAGGGYDRSRAGFVQSTELGYLNPDRSVTGIGAFGDGETGGDVDGEPFDTRVDLDGLTQTFSLYATNTVTLVADDGHVTVSGRYNRTTVRNRDAIEPGGGPGSLDGDHAFSRFNPAAGVTFSPSRSAQLLRRLQRRQPGRDVDRAGLRRPGRALQAAERDGGRSAARPGRDSNVGGRRTWRLSRSELERRRVPCRTTMTTSCSSCPTRPASVTSGTSARPVARVSSWARTAGSAASRSGPGYTFLSATYESEETVNGESNSTNDAAEDGEPGLEGSIDIEPAIASRSFRATCSRPTRTSRSDRGCRSTSISLAVSGSFARGNENNPHEPDGTYYLGSGSVPGYAVVNLGARFRLTSWMQLVAQVTNLFDRTLLHGRAARAVRFHRHRRVHRAARSPRSTESFRSGRRRSTRQARPLRTWIGTQLQVLSHFTSTSSIASWLGPSIMIAR